MIDSSGPLISIIIPVYNVEQYFERCVQSLFDQSFSNFEAILIDDGSTDGSAELCDKIAKKDKRIKTIHKQNEGVAVARSVGIKESCGQYIMFLDSDDFYDINLLKLAEQKIKDTEADIVVFGYKKITKDGQIKKLSVPTKKHTLAKLYSENVDLTFLLVNKIYKRNLFDFVDMDVIRGITFCEDSYLALSLQKNAKKIEFLDLPGYSYFIRDTSVTQNMTIKNHMDRMKAVTLMDGLYKQDLDKPYVLKKLKFDTKFFYIDPKQNFSVEFKDFLKNCKNWRKTFPEATNCLTEEVGTKKMLLYVKLISYHIDFFAYILLKFQSIKMRKIQNG
jgi:glycosyltransferase involved in cell wall biosynthesis